MRQKNARGSAVEVLGSRGGYGVAGRGSAEGCCRALENELYWRSSHRITQAMSEEQLSALLAKLKEDAGLREKLQGAADLDAAVAMAKEAGFDVSKEDWLQYQTTAELRDEELEYLAGGSGNKNETNATQKCRNCWTKAVRGNPGAGC